MNYKRLNDYTGWAVWLVATIVYLLTIEPTASFWDCGEFIASAYKLEVGHPPGAPMFMLLARLFAMFVPAVYAATAVNVMSAMASSFTILFLFWKGNIKNLFRLCLLHSKDIGRNNMLNTLL